MKRESMTIREFEYQLSRYGTELDEWPEVERRQAEMLLEANADARVVLDNERVVNSTLGALSGLEPSPLLLSRVFEIPITHPHHVEGAGWVWRNLARVGLSFAAIMLCVGGLSGWLSAGDSLVAEQSDRTPDGVSADGVSADGLSSVDAAPDEETAQWEELAEVALADELTEEWL